MTATDALRTSDDITDRLLTAAIEVFTERGIEKAGVALIARRAGLTTGAIYSRWEGKQDLLLDALDVVLMQQIAQRFVSLLTITCRVAFGDQVTNHAEYSVLAPFGSRVM